MMDFKEVMAIWSFEQTLQIKLLKYWMYLFKGAEGEILIWMVLSHRFSQSAQKDGGRIQHSQKCNCKILPTVIYMRYYIHYTEPPIGGPNREHTFTHGDIDSAAARPVRLVIPAEHLKSI